MRISVSSNKKLDLENITEFWKMGDTVILDSWPQIHAKEDIPLIINEEYRRDAVRLENAIRGLSKQKVLLEKTSVSLSALMEEPWKPISKIDIFVGFCPIAPRFLENSSMLLPCYYETSVLLNWATHEMIHFLYFKKWSKIFPNSKPQNFESPHPEWILSEILVSIIGNDPRIHDFTCTEYNMYENWQNVLIGGKSLSEIFQNIYMESKNFESFLMTSWEEYQKLDKRHKLTQKLSW